MGIWDDVDYRECERCKKKRHVTGMSVIGPARVWICTPCADLRKSGLDDLAKAGQEMDDFYLRSVEKVIHSKEE